MSDSFNGRWEQRWHPLREEWGRPLFQDILAAEYEDGRRIVCENGAAVAFVPYFGRYAYELFVAPKRRCASVAELGMGETADFAADGNQIRQLMANAFSLCDGPQLMAMIMALFIFTSSFIHLCAGPICSNIWQGRRLGAVIY